MGQKIQAAADAALAKWTPVAATVVETRPTAPVHIILGESVDVASLLDRYWHPTTDANGNRVPGFSAVSRTQSVTADLAEEIRELHLAAATAHSKYLALVQRAAPAPLDRAEFVLGELRSTLEFLFDDGKQDDADAQLESLHTAFAGAASQDALALALDAYAELASRSVDAFSKIDGFDGGLIDEARALASSLREHSALALTNRAIDEQRQTLALRNHLFTLLIDRVRRVRRTAAYVFRGFPDIARKFSSPYERKRRAARRARDAADAEAPQSGASAATRHERLSK